MAQDLTDVREEARQLVVMITCHAGNEAAIGAGVVFNADEKALHVVTAEHVIRDCRPGPGSGRMELRLRAKPDQTVRATILPMRDSALDLAVIQINREDARFVDIGSLPFDRLGDPDSLPQGFSHYEEAAAITFDRGRPWHANRADEIRTKRGDPVILYQPQGKDPGRLVSDPAARGHAGGALFTRRGYLLIGIVVKDKDTHGYPDGRALRIDMVMERLRGFKLPVKLSRLQMPQRFTGLAIGESHMCGLADAAAYCWGENGVGQLGNGMTEPLPSRVLGRIKFKSLAAARHATCGLSKAGVLFCWGSAPGFPESNSHQDESTQVRAIVSDVRFDSFTLGTTHACGLTNSGIAYCWGANDRGQLGNGTIVASSTAVKVVGNLQFKAIVAGDRHTCALSTHGRAYCWGDNEAGAIGNGSNENAPTPTLTAGGRVFQSLSVSANGSSCAVTPTGAAFCWGKNTDGNGGTGADQPLRTPSAVAGGLQFTKLASSENHTCGLARNEMYCWGYNSHGQLGNGSAEHHNGPQRVKTNVRFVELFLSKGLTCTLSQEGAAYCWGGAAGKGQVGLTFDKGSSEVPMPLRLRER